MKKPTVNHRLTTAETIKTVNALREYSGPPFKDRQCLARYLTDSLGFLVKKGNVDGIFDKPDLLEMVGRPKSELVERCRDGSGGVGVRKRLEDLETRVVELEAKLAELVAFTQEFE